MTPPLRDFTGGLVTLHQVHRNYLRMNRMDKVFVAAINGHCAAGGLELALACDIRLAADGDYMIGMTEPVLGFNPGGGGGQRLTRAVGAERSVEMLLEAHMHPPHRARDEGLVHRVVEPGELLPAAQRTAARLARRSPRAVWAVKRAAYEGFSRGWRRGLHLDRSGFVWAAVAARTEHAMRHMLDQIAELPADRHPSPWSHPRLVREWQDGTAFDFHGDPPPG
jgi:enoyl-CoA hydratase/carnithine racemase